MISCSLCAMTFDEKDSLIEQRKKRHEERHTRGLNYKKAGGGNNIIGTVEWIKE